MNQGMNFGNAKKVQENEVFQGNNSEMSIMILLITVQSSLQAIRAIVTRIPQAPILVISKDDNGKSHDFKREQKNC